MFPDQSSNSCKLFERAQTVMPSGSTRHPILYAPYLIYALEGEGCRLIDVDGVARIDFINNFSAQIHGHVHPKITRAICDQAAKLTSSICPTEYELKLAELLAERIPSVEQVRFCNSGTEAVMISLKAARAYTGRPKIMKMEGAYHGQYPEIEASIASSPDNWGSEEKPNRNPIAAGTPESLLQNVIIGQYNCVEITRQLIRDNADQLSAVIIDPFASRYQFMPPDIAFLKMLREETRKNGIILIFDEVFSLRVGYHGAQGVFGITPDITTMGKIVGGGLPIGVVGGSKTVMSVFQVDEPGKILPKVFQGGTFTANPMSMAAGYTAMSLLTREVFDQLQEQGDRLRNGLHDAARRAKLPVQVNGHGSLTALAFCATPFATYRQMMLQTGKEGTAKMSAFHRAMLSEGVVISTAGNFAGSTPMTNPGIDFTIDAAYKAFLKIVEQIPVFRK